MGAVLYLTIKETLRKRIVLVGVLLSLAFLALFGAGVHYGYQDALRHQNLNMLKMILPMQFLSLGLYFASFTVSVISIMAAVGAVSGEIESGTIYALVPRPLRRPEIILGKFLGYGLLLALFSLLFYLAVLLIVRQVTGFGTPLKAWTLGLFFLQPLVLLAVTMCGTAFLSTLANGIAVFMLYAVGMVGGMMEQFGYLFNSEVLVRIGVISSLVMPADAVYRKIVHDLVSVTGFSLTSILGPFGSGAEPSAWMLAYTGLYILGFLTLAIRIFTKRDI